MRFGMLYELQLPKPWAEDSEQRLVDDAIEQCVLGDKLGIDYACLSLIVNYAAGRGEKPIHDDLEAGTMTAKMQAMKVLRMFFGAMEE